MSDLEIDRAIGEQEEREEAWLRLVALLSGPLLPANSSLHYCHNMHAPDWAAKMGDRLLKKLGITLKQIDEEAEKIYAEHADV